MLYMIAAKMSMPTKTFILFLFDNLNISSRLNWYKYTLFIFKSKKKGVVYVDNVDKLYIILDKRIIIDSPHLQSQFRHAVPCNKNAF